MVRAARVGGEGIGTTVNIGSLQQGSSCQSRRGGY